MRQPHRYTFAALIVALAVILCLAAVRSCDDESEVTVQTLAPANTYQQRWTGPTTTQAPAPVVTEAPVEQPRRSPEPTVPPSERPQSFTSGTDGFPAGCIRKYESGGTTDEGGDYGASGGGAYQIIGDSDQGWPGTWDNYGGYARAEDAPASVQDAKAQELWDEAGRHHWAAQRGRCF